MKTEIRRRMPKLYNDKVLVQWFPIRKNHVASALQSFVKSSTSFMMKESDLISPPEACQSVEVKPRTWNNLRRILFLICYPFKKIKIYSYVHFIYKLIENRALYIQQHISLSLGTFILQNYFLTVTLLSLVNAINYRSWKFVYDKFPKIFYLCN